MSVLAFLALGANLGDPVGQLQAAAEHLDAEDLRVLRRGRVYRSAPVGPPGQPDYLNTALAVATTLAPLALLDRAKAVETALGRTPGVRWGPRVIDVDLALYGDAVVELPRLRVPHAALADRRFVLAPLADLEPGLRVPPSGRTVAALLAALGEAPEELRVVDDRVLSREALFSGTVSRR